MADVTAGLKAIQIKGILQPQAPATEDADVRLRYIKGLVGGDEGRAKKLAAITSGMSHDEIRDLIGAKDVPAAPDDSHPHDEILTLIAKRKREIIERESLSGSSSSSSRSTTSRSSAGSTR